MNQVFTQLIGTSIRVGKCSHILPNHLQCWRGADVQVTVPATESEAELKFQLCQQHATILRRGLEAVDSGHTVDAVNLLGHENFTSEDIGPDYGKEPQGHSEVQ